MEQQRLCWINGRWMPSHEATVSVFDHGLLYGDGVFEGLRFYPSGVFKLGEHLARLWRSASVLRITIPYTAHELGVVIERAARDSGMASGYIRVIVTRGAGKLGIDPRSCKQPCVIVIADEIAVVDDVVRRNGARVIVAATRRLAPDGLDPRVKSLNYLNPIMAKWEAINAHADEAILLNAQGYVSEGSVDNIFIVKNATLLTPPVYDGALEGITRGVVIRLAEEAGIPMVEQRLTTYDLYTADECFLTGTAAELIPVREIDGRVLPQTCGPVYNALSQLFAAATH
ncbi:MAG: branched-chain-amino-acid transaminase [Gammaproteobacteria bacterium]|nr:branched-chain-amino-acid transaminase [Gammaproteobacteria bacterium]